MPLTGVDLHSIEEGSVVLFEDAFQMKEGAARCYGLQVLPKV